MSEKIPSLRTVDGFLDKQSAGTAPVRSLSTDRIGLLQALSNLLDKGAPGTSSVALMCIDIDHFREINFSCGFDVGDTVLQDFAQRLQGSLRQSDSLYRIGDDEFAVLLPSILHEDHVVLAAHKIRASLEEPIVVPGYDPMEIRASIGIALFPDTADNKEELLRQANMAMHRAKSSQSGYAVYHKVATPGNISPLQFARELRRAVADNELHLHFQPKFDLRTGSIIGVEALCRWTHPQHGVVMPGEFIQVAEETGIITSITVWALNAALRQSIDWQAAGEPITVSVNLSAHDLKDEDFPELVRRALKTWRMDPRRLILEITETAMMQDHKQTINVLRRLSEIGVRLSIDDFGSGYSSLNYLQQMPVNELKIEKEFVINMERSESDIALVRTVIDLGHNYGLLVTAEGVETEKAKHLLAGMGCDLGQGNYFSPAINVEKLQALLD